MSNVNDVKSVIEELWVHRSDGTRIRADDQWLFNWLQKHPSIFAQLGYEPKTESPDMSPTPVYKVPKTAEAPVEARNNGTPDWMLAKQNPNAGKGATIDATGDKKVKKQPSWMNAPVNPNAGKAIPVVAGTQYKVGSDYSR